MASHPPASPALSSTSVRSSASSSSLASLASLASVASSSSTMPLYHHHRNQRHATPHSTFRYQSLTDPPRRVRPPLSRRHADAARARQAALAEKVLHAHAHNAHVAEVNARAKAQREKEAQDANDAILRRLKQAEQRRGARMDDEKRQNDAARTRDDRAVPKRTRSGATTVAAMAAHHSNARADCQRTPESVSDASHAMRTTSLATNESTGPHAHPSAAKTCSSSMRGRAAPAELPRVAKLSSSRTAPGQTPSPALRKHSKSVSEGVANARRDAPGSDAETAVSLASAQSESSSTLSQSTTDSSSAPVRQGQVSASPGDASLSKASRLASYWLLHRSRRALSSVGLLAPCRMLHSFDATSAALQDRRAEVAARQALRAVGGNPRAARVLLASFMIAAHSDHVLEGEGEEESHVLFAARMIVLSLQSGSLASVAFAWNQWRTAYDVWRNSDRKRIEAGIIADAVATEGLRHAVQRRDSAAGTQDENGTSPTTVWTEQLDQKQRQLRSAMQRIAGRAGLTALDEALERARRMPDEYLAHEIMVDLDGLLSELGGSKIPDQAWASLELELRASPPRVETLASVLHAVAQDLNAIRESCFEADRVEDMQATVAYATGLVNRIVDCVRTLQAESDDEELAEWHRGALDRLTATDDFAGVAVSVLLELATRIGELRRTVSSTRIRMLAPVVQQYGVLWERSRFSEHVRAGVFESQLPRTRALLETANASLGTDGAESDVPATPSARTSWLMKRALVDLVCTDHALIGEAAPEVWHLDVNRIVGFQNLAQAIALLAALDNAGQQFLSARYSAVWRARGTLNLELVKEAIMSADAKMERIQAAFVRALTVAVWDAAGDHSIRFSEEDALFLRGMVRRVASLEDPVYALMARRLRQALLARGTARPPASRAARQAATPASTSAPSASETPVPAGLQSVSEDVLYLYWSLQRLVDHTLRVHGESLRRLVNGLAA